MAIGLSHAPAVEERIALLTATGATTPATMDRARAAGIAYVSEAGLPTNEAALAQTELGVRSGSAEPSGLRPVAIGYRLTGDGTALYARPNVSSEVLAHLAAGSLITVSEEDGDFLRVLTHEDKVGYIPRTAPMAPVQIAGD